jgi:hypothetical protein
MVSVSSGARAIRQNEIWPKTRDTLIRDFSVLHIIQVYECVDKESPAFQEYYRCSPVTCRRRSSVARPPTRLFGGAGLYVRK